jgi:hypothetical protein
MKSYYPHKWALIEILGNDHHYRILGSWMGGYLDGDHWRINSGIKSVSEDENCYIFDGFSGSRYHCEKTGYGYSLTALNAFQRFNDKNLMIFHRSQPENIINLIGSNYSVEKS